MENVTKRNWIIPISLLVLAFALVPFGWTLLLSSGLAILSASMFRNHRLLFWLSVSLAVVFALMFGAFVYSYGTIVVSSGVAV